MRKFREILRLNACGLSNRQIAQSCNTAPSTVGEYLRRIEAAGMTLEEANRLDDDEIEKRIPFGNTPVEPEKIRPLPDWVTVHKELRRKAVTLKLLWEEYLREHSEGYSYSQFCEHYRRWAKNIDVRLRQVHKAGEKVFVDYAGLTVPIVDPQTGEIHQAQIFVATMGASSYIFAEATWTQKMHDWIESHVHSYEYFGGVPAITVPDNPKIAVSRTCRYEPGLNPTYQDMAAHYGTAVIPARVAKPRDKAKVESGVQVVERKILARIRNMKFFSLAELNQAIREPLEKVNNRPLQKLGVSRRALFIEIDKPALKALPETRYEYAEFVKARVNIDYHIEIKGHYYSVPYELRGKQIDVRVTARTIEALHRNRRVASHIRSNERGRFTTDPKHMPKAHQKYLEWTPSRILEWAGSIGPNCGKLASHIIETKPHPEQGYRACLGLTRLAKKYGNDRVEAACLRAMVMGVCSYRSVKSILETGKDSEPLGVKKVVSGCTTTHENIRGREYYGGTTEAKKPA